MPAWDSHIERPLLDSCYFSVGDLYRSDNRLGVRQPPEDPTGRAKAHDGDDVLSLDPLPPYVGWTKYVGDFGTEARGVLPETIRRSSMFSGIGTKSCATTILGAQYHRSGSHVPSFLHTCCFEIRRAARITLEQRSSATS